MKTATSYRLDADDAKLSPHVGHKVEIAGTVDKDASVPATGSTTPTSSASTAMAGANSPKLKVDTIRMIASSCSQ